MNLGFSRRLKLVWVKVSLLLLLVIVMSFLAWRGGLAGWMDPRKLTDFLSGQGLLAPLIYMAMMIGAVVIAPLPTFPLNMAAGAVFGAFWGTVYSVLGAELGALIVFLIARGLGREAIVRIFKRDITFCDLCTERHLASIIFMTRLIPLFSFDLVSFGAGLTRISVQSFALATLLGMIPPTFVSNYFGSGIFSGSRHTLLLGALIVLFFFLVPIWIKHTNPWGLYDRMMRGKREP